tara:strand:- start:1201 stop:1500 length:300 start_codon:yes stop_codon:yes gene_type:complete
MRISKRQLRKIIKETLLRESATVQSLEGAVQQLVDQGGSLFDLENILSGPRFGFNAETVTSPLPMVLINATDGKYAVLNSKYAEQPDAVVGPYAIGKME